MQGGELQGPAYHLEPPLECSESAQVESDTDHDMTEVRSPLFKVHTSRFEARAAACHGNPADSE